MNKKYLSVGILMLAVTIVFVSCKAKTDYGVIYIDPEGITHVLHTNSSGNTVVNAEGNLQEVRMMQLNDPHRNNDGSLVIDELEYPNFIDEGDVIDCKYYKLPIPRGWAIGGNLNMIIENTKINASINFSNDTKSTYEQTISDSDLFLDEAKKAGATTEKGSATILGTECVYASIITKDNTSALKTYILNRNDRIYKFVCNYTVGNEPDFVSILNTIEFK